MLRSMGDTINILATEVQYHNYHGEVLANILVGFDTGLAANLG